MDQAFLCMFAEPSNAKICAPFSFGEYSYATNGHILVRVPRLADVPEWEAVNEGATKLFDSVDIQAVIPNLVDIPKYAMPKPEKCPSCKGTGKVTTCPECSGDGEVQFDTDFHDYECECKTCDGRGHISGGETICKDCNGTGNERVMKRIAMGNTGFSSHYLSMLEELSGVKIAPTSELGPNYFKWDDGDGLLMPMRS